MIAADLVAELESRYPCIQGLHRSVCQTGEPYVVIGSEWRRLGEEHRPKGNPIPGVVREGVRRELYATEDEACVYWLRAFDLYVEDWGRCRGPEEAKPFLYWRYDAPHIFWYGDESKCGGIEVGAIKCRLVLSVLPVVPVSDADYDAQRRAELEHRIIPDKGSP